MSVIVNNVNQLKNVVLQKQISILEKVANDKLNDIVYECFQRHIQEFYDEWEGSIYDNSVRSYDMRDAIGVKISPIVTGNSVTFGVEFSGALSHNSWSNKGYNGIRHDNKYYSDEEYIEMVMSGNHGGAYQSDKKPLEEMLNDKEMMSKIISDIKNALRKDDMFIVK